MKVWLKWNFTLESGNMSLIKKKYPIMIMVFVWPEGGGGGGGEAWCGGGGEYVVLKNAYWMGWGVSGLECA
jgi:hypothetical protein